MKCQKPENCALVIALRNQVKELKRVVNIQTRVMEGKNLVELQPPPILMFQLN